MLTFVDSETFRNSRICKRDLNPSHAIRFDISHLDVSFHVRFNVHRLSRTRMLSNYCDGSICAYLEASSEVVMAKFDI